MYIFLFLSSIKLLLLKKLLWTERQTDPLPSDLRQLVTLTPAEGGLGVPDLRFEAPQQFADSTSITASHVDSTTTQCMFMLAGENSTAELKRQHQALKTASVKSRMESIDSTPPSDLLRSVNQSRDKVRAHGLPQYLLSIKAWCWINKNSESLRLRYNMPLTDLWWEVYNLPCPVMQNFMSNSATHLFLVT